MGSEKIERYELLELERALSRRPPCDYAPACIDLSSILRSAYSKLPKSLQSLVFQHTLLAFRVLPGIDTNSGLVAANILLQAAEAALPKQRKAVAVSEFKRAVVAQKRRSKSAVEFVLGGADLPVDVVTCIFRFLDVRSLAAVSGVCWAWNIAAKDDVLWRSQYSLFFGESDYYLCGKENITTGATKEMGTVSVTCQNKIEGQQAIDPDWRKALKRRFIENSWSFKSSRVYCVHCETLLWLSTVTWFNPHICSRAKGQPIKIKLLPPNKVAEYLLDETPVSYLAYESDSDGEPSEDYIIPKLWAYPKSLMQHSSKYMQRN